jgi:hypothetical protein
VRRDSDDWTYESHEVTVESSLRGEHNVAVLDDQTGCNFAVSCVGVAFEDTTRGHGWHQATLRSCLAKD